MDTLILQNLEWATDLVNEVYSEFAHSPLAGMPVAMKALHDAGITERPEVIYVLKRSQFAQVPELNLLNTLELF